jgi:hypothetical protein
MEIKVADVAELVDARDLKSPAATDNAQYPCKTYGVSPIETDGNQPHLQNNLEVDRRLFGALQTAGRGALGMPSSVDTFHARCSWARPS